MPECSKITVLPSLTDHRAVLCETQLEVATVTEIEREVWDFKKADWQGLKEILKQEDWNVLNELTVDEVADPG